MERNEIRDAGTMLEYIFEHESEIPIEEGGRVGALSSRPRAQWVAFVANLLRVYTPGPKLCKTCKWLTDSKCVHDGLAFAHDMWGDCEPGPDFGCVHHEPAS